MIRLFRPLTIVIFMLVMPSWAEAQLVLPQVFGDHMVLQRDQNVRFWGWAAPNEQISVEVDGFAVTTKASPEGKWEVLYPSHVAGGPYTIAVKASTRIELTDVWFGDVWVAGGQSNMEWKLGGKINNWEAEIADSDYPQIRFFDVPRELALSPHDNISGGEWRVAGPKTAADISAVGWFFAKSNHLEKGVPVGLIQSNWGGTPAEAWTSAERLLEVPGYEKTAAEMLDATIDWEALKKANDDREKLKWELIGDETSFMSLGAHLVEYDDSAWKTVSLPNKEPIMDFVWVRKHVNLKSAKGVRLYMGEITQLCSVFMNGQLVSKESWQDSTGIVEISPDIARKGDNVIAIRASNSWDNRVWIGRSGEMWLEASGKKQSLEGEWKYSNTLEPAMPKVERFNWKPGVLYNGMIQPIAGYGIRGAIWYQGESNADKPHLYNELFEAMIEDWRIRWRQGNFPFLFVQLANFMERKDLPQESQWAELREAQTQALQLPNTGMATIIDIGEANDIHPRNKQDVGRRLWAAARKVVFNEEVVFSGPSFSSQEIQGDRIILSFDQVGSGLMTTSGDPVGFAIAGADKQFVWAEAKIEGDQVVVWNDQIANPEYVRYAWADNPACNLYNKEGLPAVPFRTDQ